MKRTMSMMQTKKSNLITLTQFIDLCTWGTLLAVICMLCVDIKAQALS